MAATLKDVFDAHYYAVTYKDLKEKYGYDREAIWNHCIICSTALEKTGKFVRRK